MCVVHFNGFDLKISCWFLGGQSSPFFFISSLAGSCGSWLFHTGRESVRVKLWRESKALEVMDVGHGLGGWKVMWPNMHGEAVEIEN